MLCEKPRILSMVDRAICFHPVNHSYQNLWIFTLPTTYPLPNKIWHSISPGFDNVFHIPSPSVISIISGLHKSCPTPNAIMNTQYPGLIIVSLPFSLPNWYHLAGWNNWQQEEWPLWVVDFSNISIIYASTYLSKIAKYGVSHECCSNHCFPQCLLFARATPFTTQSS